jgi:UPF0716 protein FxsA
MAAALVVLFVVVPIVELAVIIQVGQVLGIPLTLGLLVVMSVIGASLLKREGLGVLRRAQQLARAGRVPGRELADAFLIVVGGALMLTPGFVSDALGLALLLPPVRAVVRPVLLAQLEARAFGAAVGRRPRGPGGRSGVIDA